MPHHEQKIGPTGWTRRRTLAALAAAPALPTVIAQPAAAAPLPAELAEICLLAVQDAAQDRLGRAAAAGRSLPEIAAALRTRLGPEAHETWRTALVASGQRDIARGDIVDILGQPLMRTEADVLALGVRLRRGV